METNKLKKFAAEARINLMDGVRRKLRLLGFDEKGRVIGKEPELIEGGTLWNGEEYPEGFYQQWTTLRDRLRERGVREVVEEAAYTWFNRMMAIRILTMNGLCEPVLRFDPATGLPLLLAYARMGRVPEMSAQERARLDMLMDDDNRTYDQFALLLTVWCHANPIISSCFGSIHDYVELLLPDNILRPDGFLAKLNDTPFITEEDYRSAELIGWLYQFYISDRKDEVFAKKGKVEAEEIPAATQIFTPNWIVKYMVENTILPQVDAVEEIIENAKYLVGTHGLCVRERKIELEDLKVADFACGSGHILNECFDLLFLLYRAESYSRREAIECIFTENLTGIDIDLRAKQLATFALLLKACQKDSSFADAHCMPHVITVPEMTAILKTSKYEDEDGGHGKAIKYDFFQNSVTHEIAVELEKALALVKDADSLGSIIKFDLSSSALRAIKETAEYWRGKEAIERPEFVNDLLPAIDFMLTLSDRYDAIVMNPPYMPTSKVDGLKDYAAKNYPDSKTDLFSVFMDVCMDRLKDGGKYGMINMQSWMFLSSFESLRKKIISSQPILDKKGNETGEYTPWQHIDSLLHLGPRTFDELSGEVVQNAAFVISKEQASTHGVYFRLIDGKSCKAKMEMLLKGANRYVVADQKQFEKIPGAPIAYWLTHEEIDSFIKGTSLSDVCETRKGLATSDNDRFLRLWHEVNVNNTSVKDLDKRDVKWYPHNKGGQFRRWYGNNEYLINWENDGFEIRNFRNPDGSLRSRPQNLQYNFLHAVTWSKIASGKFSSRFCKGGFLFDDAAAICYHPNESTLLYVNGLLNTKVAQNLLNAINPTLNIQIGDIGGIPVIIPDTEAEMVSINKVIMECISISKQDWDAHETSWDFKFNELVELRKEQNLSTLADSVGAFVEKWESLFTELHANEEELNRQIIDIYRLQKDLSSHVDYEDITILQQGEMYLYRPLRAFEFYDEDLKDRMDPELIVNEDLFIEPQSRIVWTEDGILKHLISYIVGCYMGRYRLDRPGLHIAHPNPTDEELAKYRISNSKYQFEIDSDGIIPVLPQGAPFYDNLYNYVEQFVKMVWDPENLQENMNFIEKCLGKPLNDYLMKDFWKYHKKMYQNRPIYWEFASKKGAFRALVYAHRMDRFTVEVLRSKYLLPYIAHIEKKVANMESRVADLSTPERRELDALRDKTLPELREYAERVEVVALKNITFDLDDGIIKNHALFGDIVTKLK